MACHCVRHLRGSPSPAPTARCPSRIFSHLPYSPWAQMEPRALEGCSLGPLPQHSCSPHQPGWNQPHADVRDFPYTHQTHTLKVNFKVWAGCPGYLPPTLSPHPGTPSDAFPSFFLYMQMCPFPWAMSALSFSREASLCLATLFWCQKGLEEGAGKS